MKTPYQQYYSDSYANDANVYIHMEGVRAIRSRLTNIPFRKNAKVFDIACGTGMLGKTFSDAVYGIDLNPEAVRLARKQGVKAVIGDVEKPWKAAASAFDIVLASHIIEHVRDPDALVLQSKRLLKKGGLLIVVTPNLATWFNRVLLFFGVQPLFTEVSTHDKTLGQKMVRGFAKHKRPVGHLRIFTPGALKELLELHGFALTKMAGVEFGAFPQPLRSIDQAFAHSVPLAASIIAVGKKR